MGGSYSYAEVQSVFSTALADWASVYVCACTCVCVSAHKEQQRHQTKQD